MGYKLYIGERVQSQITVKHILELEYKNVKNAVLRSNSRRMCSHETYDSCIYTKISTLMKQNTEDRCTVPWIMDNTNICSKPRDINTTFWIAWNRITNQKKDCKAPCETTLVNVGAKNYQKIPDRNYSQMYVYFSPFVFTCEEHYLYSFLKLVAEVGGYLGLFRLTLWGLDLCKFGKLRENSKIKHNPKKVDCVEVKEINCHAGGYI